MTVLVDTESPSAAAVYDAALTDHSGSVLTLHAGSVSGELPLDRWRGKADQADIEVLDRFAQMLPGRARVLDMGCGPGRHAAYLRSCGMRVLGVDTSPAAVMLTRRRGVAALCTDVLGRLPRGSHAWDGVLLLDGNIGIGGDPLLLLCRVRDLLSAKGVVLVELDAAGVTVRVRAVLADGARTSAPFPWAHVGSAADLERMARIADLRVLDSWEQGAAGFVALGIA